MNLLNKIKLKNVIPPVAIKDDAAWVSTILDQNTDIPSGARGVLFVIALGATDIAMAALKVQQSDAKTNDTTLDGGADLHNVATKPGADDDNKIWLVYVPIAKWTKRYLQLQATAGDGTSGTFMAAVAIYDLPGESEVTAESLGAGNVSIV
jgi:hypothetical protein